MVTIVKHEWHQTDRQYAIELDEALLSEIYPEMEEEEITNLIEQIENGDFDIEDVINDAYNNDVELEWDFQYDDCWTDRKGGYDITYELGDEDSWVTPPQPTPAYHKCTKCRWEGGKYETLTQHLREDGTVIEDYYGGDEDSHSEKEVCPMCDSEVKLTEYGEKEEKEWADRKASWATEDEEEAVPCFSCGEEHKESELIEMSGQYTCPSCGDGWVMMDSREEETDEEAEQRITKELEELKREFDNLMISDNDDKARK